MLKKIKEVLTHKPKYNLSPQALRKLEDAKWRNDHNKWRWWVFISFGFYSGFVLLIQGIRCKSRRLKISAGIVLLTFFTFGIIANSVTEGEPNYDLISSIGTFGLLASCAFGFWATVKFGSDVLVWKATKDEISTDWVEANLGIPTKKLQHPPRTRDLRQTQNKEPIVPIIEPGTQHMLSDVGLNPKSALTQNNFEGTLEVNSASEQELKNSSLFTDDQILLVMNRRKAMQFKSIEDLRLTLDLKPHEIVRLGKVIRFSNENGPTTTSGRVLDF